MRRSMFVFMVLLMSSLMAGIVNAAPESGYLEVILQSYEPYPAEPGSYITVKIKADNIGKKEAPNVKFELLPEYPFSLDPNENAEKRFGSLDPGDDVVLEYKVRVDEKAVIGQNELKLRYTYDGMTWARQDFDIQVRLAESILTVSDITTDPGVLPPGEPAQLVVELSNLAGTALRDVSVNLDLAAQSSDGMALPFAPLYSTSEKALRYIGGGEVERLTFDLITYPDAESRIYRIPLTVSYKDESGTAVTKNDVIGIVVGAEPSLTAAIESVDMMGGSYEVSVRLINKGVTDLKFLDVRLEETDDYKILSTSNEVYIGGLDSDDFDSASFRISPTGETSSIELPLILEYKDANNNAYADQVTLTMDLSALQALAGGSGGSTGTLVVIMLVLVGVGFFFYKRHKKKKKRQQH